MPLFIPRAVRKPFNPDFPLLYKARAFKAGEDARWRGVPKSVKSIDSTRVHEMQLRQRTR